MPQAGWDLWPPAPQALRPSRGLTLLAGHGSSCQIRAPVYHTVLLKRLIKNHPM
ncbi:hypothetical protein LZ31DRAFT_560766 [Colletotrichum somersetense]|nr:hypothetical protein LZ31DRAFT_560766 [Colletotrichum somersetense]